MCDHKETHDTTIVIRKEIVWKRIQISRVMLLSRIYSNPVHFRVDDCKQTSKKLLYENGRLCIKNAGRIVPINVISHTRIN